MSEPVSSADLAALHATTFEVHTLDGHLFDCTLRYKSIEYR